MEQQNISLPEKISYRILKYSALPLTERATAVLSLSAWLTHVPTILKFYWLSYHLYFMVSYETTKGVNISCVLHPVIVLRSKIYKWRKKRGSDVTWRGLSCRAGLQSDRPETCVAAMFCGQLLARRCVCSSGRCTQHSDCWPCQRCEGVRICGMEVQCHSILSSALEGGEWWASCFSLFNRRKRTEQQAGWAPQTIWTF